jgi:hypothetical protein
MKIYFSSQQLITLNRRRILQDMSEGANITIHSQGLATPTPGRHTAWINLDIPIPGQHPQVAPTMITAESFTSEEDALERAADRAIRMLIEGGNIVVYDSMRTNRTRLHCSGLTACQSNQQLAKTACENTQLRRAKDELLTHLAYACTNFDDVLPIKVVQPPTNPADLSTGVLKYTGSTPPTTRLEQLASFILHNIVGPEYTKIKPRSGMDELD